MQSVLICLLLHESNAITLSPRHGFSLLVVYPTQCRIAQLAMMLGRAFVPDPFGIMPSCLSLVVVNP